jgi:ribosome maturation factor RimP
MGPAERVRELVEPVLATSDLELVDVEVGRGLVRLSLDRPGGIDLEAISAISPAISAALDGGDPLPESYHLEVSSPGLERPLRTPEQFRRFVGSRVSVRTLPGVDGDRRVVGVLADADDEGIAMAPDGGDVVRRVPYRDIERARTVFEWGPAPKPGAPKKKANK